MRKDTVININPFHAELKTSSGRFTLVFYAPMGDDYSRRKIVKVHFEDWWAKLLASLLWKLINIRKMEINDIETEMRDK